MAVVEAAYERIYRYPCHRRPARVAANLVWDTRQTLWREPQKEAARVAPLEPITDEIADELPDLFGLWVLLLGLGMRGGFSGR